MGYHTRLLYIVVLLLVILSLLSHKTIYRSSATSLTALPNCPEKCGNITVPYPFGIGDDCHYGNPIDGVYYNFTCDSTRDPPSLTFGPEVEVVNINLANGELRATHYVSFTCFDKDKSEANFVLTVALERLTISPTQNSLIAIGCDTYAWFVGAGITNGTLFNSGCMTVCNYAQKNLLQDKCSGIGCCLGFIPDGVNNISIEAKSLNDHSNVSYFNPCSVAFIVANDAMPSFLGDFLTRDATYFKNLKFPVVHHWSIGTDDCKTAKSSGGYICKGNSSCSDVPYQLGYRCQCNSGFQGNPYLHDCQDVDECAPEHQNLCAKPEYCVNTVGSYECLCPRGYSGNGTKNNPCILNPSSALHNDYKLLVGLSTTFGSTLSFLVGWWLYRVFKRRQSAKKKTKYFERNGGLLLQQEVYSDENVERIKIFTIDELEKATDHFNEDRILGQGGRGTVYKGMLGKGRIVAIKKSKLVKDSDKNQLGEFINEVVILSRINHRNIVKLLGCCLETEVPLLVYEFIPNGSLFYHIHNPSQEFPITWKMRLQIASDSAGALAYLHYSSYVPIFHRDIKSSNILLDEKYRAKLSDFGTSRFVATDKTHLTTSVIGTFGYLDPEYFRSSKFTEKSDVYSFGVVLVELLTGQKAIRATLEDLERDRSLISWFLSKMENSCLLDIVDPQLLQEGSEEEFFSIADVAKRCLNLDGKRRPTMKEVLFEIDVILSRHLPQMLEPNKAESEQSYAETFISSDYNLVSGFCSFDLESRSLNSTEVSDSLLFKSK